MKAGALISLAVLSGLGMALARSQAADPPPAHPVAVAQPATARSPAPAGAQKDEAGQSCDCESSCEKDAAHLLLSFLQRSPQAGQDAAAAVRAAAAEQQVAIEFLLALVPDPGESSVDFDEYLDAVGKALEHSQYTQDRFWLPWVPEADRQKAREGQKPDRCHERHPGVVLFRHLPPPGQGDGKRVLVLLLVGETPTEGLHAPAFARALADATALASPGWDHRVRVLGPTFSGSVSSLSTAIASTPADLHFEVISGSATRAHNKAILEQDARTRGRVSFHATVIPDEIVIKAFYDYLVHHLGASLQDVAVLSESTTPYGKGFMPGKAEAPADGGHPRLVLPFPVHISRLRSAWDKDQGSKMPPADPGPRRTLPRSQESQDRFDIPPLLSPTTVSRDDLALANILSTICSERIRYVGLLSLDGEDKRFLAQQLRLFCPDVRLFTLDSDILDAHPDERDRLKGMLIAATYPLYSRNQLWTFPNQGRHERLQFTSGSVQGVYNATLALLGRSEDLLEYAYPFQSLPSAQEADLRPPVWILAVGDDTLVPLSVRRYDPSDYLFQPGPAQRPAGPPDNFQLTFQLGMLNYTMLVLGFLCALSAAGYFAVNYGKRKRLLWRLFRSFKLPDLGSRSGETFWQYAYLLVSFLVLTGTYAMLTGLFFVPLRWGTLGASLWRDARSWPIGLFCVVCLLCLLWTLLDILVRLVRAVIKRDPWVPGWRWALWLVPASLIGGLLLRRVIFFAVDVSWDEPAQAILFFNRAANPAYGLSPVAPLCCLAAALYLWGYSGLRRICLLSESIDARPPPGVTRRDAEDPLGQMNRRLKSFVPQAYLAYGLCLIFIWQILGRMNTLEGQGFNIAYALGVTFVYSAVVVIFIRFLLVWRLFRRFLRLLSDQPMADAYDRMPSHFSRSIGMQFLERIAISMELEALWQHFRLLANHFGHFARAQGETLATALSPPEEVQQHLDRFQQKIDESRGYEQLSDEQRQDFFRGASEALSGVLGLFWARRPLRAALLGKPPVKPGPDILTTNTAALYMRFLPDDVHLWLRLAEDFLAIQVVTYISRVFPLLRNLLIFVMAGLLLLLASVALYPFQPQRLLMILNWVLILSVVALTLWVFVQMNQDEVLSRIAKSEPGKITWDWTFVSRILIYGVFPLTSLLAAQFPEVRGILFAWVEPLLRALK